MKLTCCACGNRIIKHVDNFGDGRSACSQKCLEVLRKGQDGNGGWLCLTHPRLQTTN